MTARTQIFAIILTLSVAISAMLFGASAFFLRQQGEANLRNHMEAQIISFSALLGAMEVDSYDDPNIQAIITDDYRRILRRLTRGRSEIEFHLMTPDATRVIWTTNNELAENVRQAATSRQDIFDTLAAGEVFMEPLDILLQKDAHSPLHAGFVQVTDNTGRGADVRGILSCVINSRPYLAFSSNFIVASITIILCATTIVIVVAEITVRIFHAQLARLTHQIEQSIKQPGTERFQPGLIAETNALGDALDTLDILLEDENARTRHSILNSRNLEAQQQIVALLKQSDSGAKRIKHPPIVAQFVPVGNRDYEWFACSLETPAGLCHLWGFRSGSAKTVDGFADIQATQFVLLGFLEEHADNPFRALKSIIDHGARKGLNHLGISLTPPECHELHLLIWNAGDTRETDTVHQGSYPFNSTICTAFQTENEIFTQSYIAENSDTEADSLVPALEAILKEDKADIIALFYLEPQPVTDSVS